MLRGIDRSMFESPAIFDIGLLWLRMDHGSKSENEFMPLEAETSIKLLPEAGTSVAELIKMFDDMNYLPSHYPFYCEEIESRHQLAEIV